MSKQPLNDPTTIKWAVLKSVWVNQIELKFCKKCIWKIVKKKQKKFKTNKI